MATTKHSNKFPVISQLNTEVFSFAATCAQIAIVAWCCAVLIVLLSIVLTVAIMCPDGQNVCEALVWIR